eukprot:5884243-Karenia_brevis.AAC.1
MTMTTSFSSESSLRRNKSESSLGRDKLSNSLRIILNHNESIEDETARMRMKEMQSHAKLLGICLWRRRSEDKT